MGGQKHKKHGKSGGGGGGKSKPQQQHTSSGAGKPVTINDISPEFQTIILDFLRDIDCSFPEYREVLAPYLGYSHEMKPMPDELYIELYSHCREIYPVKFFDILYKNETLFAKAQASTPAPDAPAPASVEFLPGVDFRDIWATEDITDNTKDIIWKYLQLILFSIVNNLSDMGSFGDTAKLFEAIDDSELKTKLEEVIGEMGDMFGNAAGGTAGAAGAAAGQNTEGLDETFKKASEFMNEAFAGAAGAGAAGTGPTSTPPIPDASSIHEHLSGILNGKIGKLAKEIAEETAADLNLDMENETSMKGIFQQLLKNPGKLSGIIKSVGSKLDSKLKSGELKESEIMQEASELMSKMKSMPGMNNLASMLSKMGMNVPGGMGGGGGGGGKVNFGAMQSQLNKNMKQAQMRERLLKKVQDKQAAAAAAAQAAQQQQQQTHTVPPSSGQNTAVFKSGEKPAKTPRPQPTQASAAAAASAAASAASAAASAASAAASAPKQKSD
jgi:hypothetical protein